MPTTTRRPHKPFYYISAKPITTPGVHPESDGAEIVGWSYEVKETRSNIEVNHLRSRGIKLYADRLIAKGIANTNNRQKGV